MYGSGSSMIAVGEEEPRCRHGAFFRLMAMIPVEGNHDGEIETRMRIEGLVFDLAQLQRCACQTCRVGELDG